MKTTDEKRGIGYFKKWLRFFFFIVLAFVFFTYFAAPVFVFGESMQPTLCNGDVALSDRLSGVYSLGDIVTVHHDGKTLVKRIVGVPNTTIEIDGKIYELSDGEYFVVGDNLERSRDSRDFGTVSREKITGRVIYRLVPLGKIM